VPFNSFSEFNKAEGGDIWFAIDETRPLACFAGLWPNWTSVRKVNARPRTTYALLTREPNAEIDAIHPKAMPVILTAPEEVETWMTAPLDEALKPQRPLPDGSLRIVARGVVGGGSGATIPRRYGHRIHSNWLLAQHGALPLIPQTHPAAPGPSSAGEHREPSLRH
jgi:putative SOS response-associated peptidase YedK